MEDWILQYVKKNFFREERGVCIKSKPYEKVTIVASYIKEVRDSFQYYYMTFLNSFLLFYKLTRVLCSVKIWIHFLRIFCKKHVC